MRILVTETTWTTMTFAKVLEDQGFMVTRASDGADALQYAGIGLNDAIVIDADLSDMCSRNMIAAIRGVRPDLPIFLVASGRTAPDTAEMLALGADDVFAVPFDFCVIAQRIRAVVRRAAGLASPQIEFGALLLNLASRQLLCLGRPIHLTRYEYEIIEMLSLRLHQFVRREDIMTQLYAFDDEPSDKIIDVYLSRIRAKLRAAGLSRDAIVATRNRGHMLVSEEKDCQAAA